jgi:starch-binding outer membrane protein, SusD/RagB family
MRFNTLGKSVLAVCCALFLACDVDVGDLNNPSLENLQDTPTRTGIASASTGMLHQARVMWNGGNGYVSMLGIIGRESFNFDPADPRYVTEMLMADQLDPGSPAFGGNFWTLPYRNIRAGHIVINALEVVSGMTDAEKEATRGFVKTLQALEFLAIANTRDSNGGPIDVDRRLDEELAPIESKENLLAHVATLLDQAKVHLAAGGTAFPFALSTGFTGFNTPTSFLKVNRAIAARVHVYRGQNTEALTALTESFLDPAASLELGAFHVYATGAGDLPNTLNAATLYAHPSLVTDADLKADATIDDRVTRKTRDVTAATVQGYTSNLGWDLYQGQSTKVPIVRNEELILLRAEANAALGNVGPAADDVNLIRTTSGGLAARTDLDASNLMAEILKQRRYSLLFEGGHRWIDMRRHGRLAELQVGSDHVHERYPIPSTDMDARQ